MGVLYLELLNLQALLEILSPEAYLEALLEILTLKVYLEALLGILSPEAYLDLPNLQVLLELHLALEIPNPQVYLDLPNLQALLELLGLEIPSPKVYLVEAEHIFRVLLAATDLLGLHKKPSLSALVLQHNHSLACPQTSTYLGTLSSGIKKCL